MTFYDISFESPLDNILFDEVLLQQAAKEGAGESLRLWESPVYFIVLGLAGKPEDDVHTKRCVTDKIPVLRRTSGGGTVIQGPGCLNFSLVLSKQKRPALNDLHQSYREILLPVVERLKQEGVNTQFHPVSDLALEDGLKKFSGNAQHRLKDFILHHGTLLYDFDLGFIEKYLAMPKNIPDYRMARPHHNFVTNIALSKSQLYSVFHDLFPCSRISHRISEVQKDCLNSLTQKLSSILI